MNIGKMMRQVQEMQSKMGEMQAKLGDVEVVGQAGGGMVVARMTGKAELRKITIDPQLLTDDKEMLEDLIVAAVNDAKAKVEAAVAQETQKMMGDVKLPPGVKLPF